MLLSPVVWAQLSKLSVLYYLRSPMVPKTHKLRWKLWHKKKTRLATYCRRRWKPAENLSWHRMFYAKLTISTPMKDITVQNVRLHLQENTSKVISSLFYIHCYFWPLFLSLLMCFTLSKMQLEILKKIYFQFFTCPVHFPFFFLTCLKLICSPSFMAQLWFQPETITT